ncbi:GNAT family N-acetyltransferase [Croceicoccus sp. Ery5]|uniref:GNAT family N-acetyltransferase n=1 Tax=Croceicoccus sp. Ery5 TaxID=1703340 RepID=UPI001E35AE1C|nr:GNAT family N-acetyltransferase [Croceicoccus sp. Ery5]
MTGDFTVGPVALDDLQLQELLALHLAGMHEFSPADAVHALDLSGLAVPELTMLGAWAAGGRLAAMGAIKRLGHRQGEVKSMRTHPDFLRQGAAAALLDAIIARARDEGLERLSLETGSGAVFEPALALYRKRGFAHGEAFAGYTATAFNQFLHMQLG